MPAGPPSKQRVLTINAGSSSLKFALFCEGQPLSREIWGKFERIGLPEAEMSVTEGGTRESHQRRLPAPNHETCVPALVEALGARTETVRVVGHRIVHGGRRYREPQRVTPEMLAELRQLSLFAPEHLPAEIALLEELGRRFPKTPQVACFDTAFHRDMPRVAQLLPLPRRYEAQGVQRYGFHGLSYTYLLRELERVGGAAAAKGRVILAHLGNGASMAAVRDGRSLDTTMGFTPAAGLVMSTRCGDIDPGLVAYLARSEGMTAGQFNAMVNAQSGLLGVSEISPDVRDLLAQEDRDVRAAEALALFCQQAKKWIGALAAVLNGLETLVFSAGIGENTPVLRERICAGLGFLGIDLDSVRNQANAPVISKDGSKVTVRIIRTDEELLIAQSASDLAPPGVQSTADQSTHRKRKEP